MRQLLFVLAAGLLISLAPLSALADVSDYVSGKDKVLPCPKMIVVRPEISSKNVLVPLEPSEMETASQMIGSAIANKFDGSRVISEKDIEAYKVCDVPVMLTKLKSYTVEPAWLGQHEGKAVVQILRFKSPFADAPEKGIDVTATGERHWGDSLPFMNAIKAVSERIQKTQL